MAKELVINIDLNLFNCFVKFGICERANSAAEDET